MLEMLRMPHVYVKRFWMELLYYYYYYYYIF